MSGGGADEPWVCLLVRLGGQSFGLSSVSPGGPGRFPSVLGLYFR